MFACWFTITLCCEWSLTVEARFEAVEVLSADEHLLGNGGLFAQTLEVLLDSEFVFDSVLFSFSCLNGLLLLRN